MTSNNNNTNNTNNNKNSNKNRWNVNVGSPLFWILLSFCWLAIHSLHYYNIYYTVRDQRQSFILDNNLKLLYTVTTLAEYNTGKRSTTRGSDRFQETLIPIVTQSIESLVQDYDVDLYLICGFTLKQERLQLLIDQLPPQVGVQVWDDALPMNYNMKDIRNHHNNNNNNTRLEPHTRGLARQHRFVLKDKLPYYDVFLNFEDDMLVKAPHVNNYLQMTQHLESLRKEATTGIDDKPTTRITPPHYYGPLTQQQLKRIIPGFMRVEVVLNETLTPIPEPQVQVPVDLTPLTTPPPPLDIYNNNTTTTTTSTTTTSTTTTTTTTTVQTNHSSTIQLDPSTCCHVSRRIAHERLPETPTVHQLVTWEVQILPLGVRKMPALLSSSSTTNSNYNYTLDWVFLQRGTEPKPEHALGDYWSGTDGYYRNDTVHWRPASHERKYINNQGGYMATRQQLVEWHLDLCGPVGFLPPFDGTPYNNMNGLDLRDVEYWSGGLQLVTRRNACNLQRIVNLDPTHFSQHILYHTANNKQAQLQHVRERFTRLDDLYGMLNTVVKNAQRAIPIPIPILVQ